MECNLELFEQAVSAERQGRFDDARRLLRELIFDYDPFLTLDARLKLARLCVEGDDAAQTETKLLLSGIKELVLSSDSHHILIALNLRALLERRQGKHEIAKQLLEKSPAQRHEQSPEKSQCLHFLGMIYLDLGEWERAQTLFSDAYEMAKVCGVPVGLAEICDSLTDVCSKTNQTRDAIKYCQESLKGKQELKDLFGSANTFGVLGRIFVRCDKRPEAIIAFEAGLEIARELENQFCIDRLKKELDSLL